MTYHIANQMRKSCLAELGEGYVPSPSIRQAACCSALILSRSCRKKTARTVSFTPSKTQARLFKQLSVKDFVDDATLRYSHPALEPVEDLKLDEAVFAAE